MTHLGAKVSGLVQEYLPFKRYVPVLFDVSTQTYETLQNLVSSGGFETIGGLLQESVRLYDQLDNSYYHSKDKPIERFGRRLSVAEQILYQHLPRHTLREIHPKREREGYKRIRIDFSRKALKRFDNLVRLKGFSKRAELAGAAFKVYAIVHERYQNNMVRYTVQTKHGKVDIALLFKGLQKRKENKTAHTAKVISLTDRLKKS